MPHSALTAPRLLPMQRDTTPPVVAVGELQSLFEDWRRHLRAKNRSPATIDSQLIVGRAFADYLTQHGMSTDAGVIGSEHSPSLEHSRSLGRQFEPHRATWGACRLAWCSPKAASGDGVGGPLDALHLLRTRAASGPAGKTGTAAGSVGHDPAVMSTAVPDTGVTVRCQARPPRSVSTDPTRPRTPDLRGAPP